MLREDCELPCKQCGELFIFSAGEQEFFHEKSWAPPIRCQPCREEKKASGVWGTRAVKVDALTRQVLCARCGKPASRNFSLKHRKAVCAECGGMDMPTVYHDAITVEEWITIAGEIVRKG